MKCQTCGKKEANVKYYENVNGKKQTLYICEQCANNFGFSNFSDFSSLFSPIFTTIPEFNLLEKKKCNLCGYTIDDYLNTGMLGCQNCYKVFETHIDELVYKINGKNKHIKLDKTDKKMKKEIFLNNIDEKNEMEIKKLKEKLQKLIIEEKYEEAAVIRDEIKRLKGNGEK